MKNKNIVRVLLASAILGMGSMFGVANATSISGKFTLVQDSDNVVNNIAKGDVVAVIDYDAVDTGTTQGSSNVFNVTNLELTDRTALLDTNANGIFGDDPSLIGDVSYGTSMTISGAVSALFDTASGAFVGLSGSIVDFSSIPDVRTFIFNASGGSLSFSSATITNTSTMFGDSFTLVPEPNILMLFGAGLIAVGLGRRRSKAA